MPQWSGWQFDPTCTPSLAACLPRSLHIVTGRRKQLPRRRERRAPDRRPFPRNECEVVPRLLFLMRTLSTVDADQHEPWKGAILRKRWKSSQRPDENAKVLRGCRSPTCSTYGSFVAGGAAGPLKPANGVPTPSGTTAIGVGSMWYAAEISCRENSESVMMRSAIVAQRR